MADYLEPTYGEGDEVRTLVLMRVLQESEKDARMIAIGLQALKGDTPRHAEIELSFLRGLAGKMADRISPYVEALNDEYLALRREQPNHYH